MGLLTQPQAAFTATIDTAALTASFQNLSQFVYPDSIDGGHYLWHFGDGATSTQANPTHTYTQGGNYTVTLTAIVCSDTSVFVQEVSTWAVGVNNNTLNQPIGDVYPNPTNDALYMTYQLDSNELATFDLFDSMGRLVFSKQLNGHGQLSVDAKTFSNGIYYCRVISNGKMLKQSKVIVVK